MARKGRLQQAPEWTESLDFKTGTILDFHVRTGLNHLGQVRLELLQLVDNLRAAGKNGRSEFFKMGRVTLSQFGESHDDGQGVIDGMLHIPEFFMQINKVFMTNYIWLLHWVGTLA